VLDTHNALKAEKWITAGFAYHALGTGGLAQGKVAAR
jgi:hypothetical protein